MSIKELTAALLYLLDCLDDVDQESPDYDTLHEAFVALSEIYRQLLAARMNRPDQGGLHPFERGTR